MGTTLTQRDWNTLTSTLMDKHRTIIHGHVHARRAPHRGTATVMNEQRQTHTQMITVTWLEARTPPTHVRADHRDACFPSHPPRETVCCESQEGGCALGLRLSAAQVFEGHGG